MDPTKVDRTDIDRKIMSEAVVEKTWQIPEYNGKGPVTICLRMPEVTITDSHGRHIVISPEQAELVSARMDGISCWFEDITDED